MIRPWHGHRLTRLPAQHGRQSHQPLQTTCMMPGLPLKKLCLCRHLALAVLLQSKADRHGRPAHPQSDLAGTWALHSSMSAHHGADKAVKNAQPKCMAALPIR